MPLPFLHIKEVMYDSNMVDSSPLFLWIIDAGHLLDHLARSCMDSKLGA